jgi:hypothetical protein
LPFQTLRFRLQKFDFLIQRIILFPHTICLNEGIGGLNPQPSRRQARAQGHEAEGNRDTTVP